MSTGNPRRSFSKPVAAQNSSPQSRSRGSDGQPARAHKYERPIRIERGGELGMFEMGSMVILIFEKGRVEWESALAPDRPVRLGERI